MRTRTESILKIMKILAWIAFIGFMIKAGAYLFTSVISYFNIEAAKNLYEGMNLYELREYNLGYYSLMVAIIIILASLKAIVWWMIVKVISSIKLESPFTMDVAKQLEYISYSLLAIFVFGITGSSYAGWLRKFTTGIPENLNSGEFIFAAGLVFIISQIFKRGVELQSESDLIV